MKSSSLLFFIFLILFHQVKAQDNTIGKFGKISVADFQRNAAAFDSGANAVYIADIGTISFEGNYDGSFNIIFNHFMRVKIINKNGMDAGSREISIYHGNGEYEKITTLKGVTYNLENGAIIETKLDEKSVFTQKYNGNIDEKKFSMPGLKEGSIFDLEYTVKSPYFSRLTPWSFQGSYPRLWSEFTVTIPSPLHYVMRIQGDEHFKLDTSKLIPENYTIRVSNGTSSDQSYHINGNSTYRKWIKTNIHSMQEEPYTSTIDNYLSTISFQLEYVQWDKDAERHYHKSTWNLLSKDLMEDPDFGSSLNNETNWLTDEVNKIIQDSKTDLEKTAKLYRYVRDNFKSNDHVGLYTDGSLKDIFKKRSGNVADINLLLTAMLIKANIKASPLILSTRANGMANPSYPLMAEYNYVICAAFPDDKFKPLDASQEYLKFGELPLYCYNGYGHIIDPVRPVPVFFSADSVEESGLTRVIIFSDEKGKLFGSYTCNPGRDETATVRESVAGSSLKEYEKKISGLNESSFSISKYGIDSLKHHDEPITIHFDFELKDPFTDDIVYFNPMLNEGYKNNPFKAANRQYPVEMPCRINDLYILNMDIPEGYKVDELPKSARVAYNENEGMFEYLIQASGGKIQMQVKLKMSKAFFPTDEYSTLRDFFAYVVQKESEQIVFKKVK